MEARAINRYIGTSPRKMRLAVDLIRGKNVEEALSILHFTPKHAARTAEQVLRSAISNIQNKEESGRVDTATLYVKEAFVDGGATMKRIMPAPMGRAFRVRKRSNHITIVIAQREAPKPAVPKEKAAAAAPKIESKKAEPKKEEAKKTETGKAEVKEAETRKAEVKEAKTKKAEVKKAETKKHTESSKSAKKPKQ
jgi:large subunit ribosomal protein L22